MSSRTGQMVWRQSRGTELKQIRCFKFVRYYSYYNTAIESFLPSCASTQICVEDHLFLEHLQLAFLCVQTKQFGCFSNACFNWNYLPYLIRFMSLFGFMNHNYFRKPSPKTDHQRFLPSVSAFLFKVIHKKILIWKFLSSSTSKLCSQSAYLIFS